MGGAHGVVAFSSQLGPRAPRQRVVFLRGKSLGRTSTRSTGATSLPANHSFPHSRRNPSLDTA